MSDQEDRFTVKSAFCPTPEDWHSPDSEATEDEITLLIGALVRAIQPEFVLETGTYFGHTAHEISMALFENGHGRLVTIEKESKTWQEANKRLAGLTNVENIWGNTMEYVPPQTINFAFFDSWQEGRAEEFMRFYNMGFLKGGTIVAFHDTAPHHQVWKYVKQLEDEGYIKSITIHSPRGLTIAQVQ